MYSVTAALKRRSCSAGSLGPGQLALHQNDFLLPGVGTELNVLQVPVVVGDADARGAGLRGRLGLEPAAQRIGGDAGLIDLGLEGARGITEPSGELGEIGGLLFDGPGAVRPEVGGVAGEILLGLGEEARDGADAGLDLGDVRRLQREVILPEFDRAISERAFPGRLIARIPEHGEVERGVPDPGH